VTGSHAHVKSDYITNNKTYRIVASAMTLCDLEDSAPIAGLLKCLVEKVLWTQLLMNEAVRDFGPVWMK